MYREVGVNRLWNRRQWLALVVAALLASACATTTRNLSTADTAPLDHLLTLIVERLVVAPDVARTKWNTRAPIEDLGREQQIISAVGAGASSYNVPRDTAEHFLRAQIEASKIIQRAMFAEYETARQPPFKTVVDLDKEIRPKLDRLTPEMMIALGQALPVLERAGGRKALEALSRRRTVEASGGHAAMQAALAPLLDISR